MFRPIYLLVFGICFLAALFVDLPSANRPLSEAELGFATAHAQQAKKKRRSLFNILFGRKGAKKKAVTKKPRVRKRRLKKKARRIVKSKSAKRQTSKSAKTRFVRRKAKRKPNTKRRAVIVVPPPSAVEKRDDAKVVLVVGDFFASNLAKGLEEALAEVPGVVVVNRANGISGFVRDDVVNWPEVLGSMVEELKPSYIVAMAGANDRQAIRANRRKIQKRTPQWIELYTKRIETFGTELKKTGVPYSWMGIPPVSSSSLNRDFLYFNELYEKAASSPTGKLIDVWDGFSDADGNYSRSGPDVSGQIVLLRGRDGINLTRAGRRRLAYYVQGQILKALDTLSPGNNPSLAFDIESQLPKSAEYDPARTGRTVVIRLNDPASDGAESLAGEKVNLENGIGRSRAIPTLNAPQPVTLKEGRVDDYNWPPSDVARGGSAASVAAAN